MYEHTAPRTATQDADAALEAVMEQSAHALQWLGIGVEDLLDELPAAQEEVLRGIYGDTYMLEIEHAFASFRERHAQDTPVTES
jgi:hypothetical protein